MLAVYLVLNILTGGIALGFLFWLTHFLQETRRDGEDSAPARLEHQGTYYEIHGGQALLGRDPNADIVLSDMKISNRQAFISYSSDRQAWYVTRLGQAPLYVDGHEVAQHKSVALVAGTTIQLANKEYIIFHPGAASQPPVTAPPFRLRRFVELRLLLLASVFLFCGLLTVNIGLRLDVLDGPAATWNWLPLWLAYTSAWAGFWLTMNAADWLQHWRHYATGQIRSRYPHQTILPMIAFLIAIAVLVGYRGEAVALSPAHAQFLDESQFKDSIRLDVRMDEGDTWKMLMTSIVGIAIALGVRILMGSFLDASPHINRPWQAIQHVRWGALVGAQQHRHLVQVLAVPVFLVCLSIGLLVAEVLGFAVRTNGQLVHVRVIGQPSEAVRLLTFFYIIWLVAAWLQQRLQLRDIVGGLGGLLIGLLIYYVVTRDLGPLLVNGLFTLGLLLLPLSRRSVLWLTAGFLGLLVAIMLISSPLAILRDTSFRQFRSWLSRPALNRTNEEYDAFCQTDFANASLCGDDQSLRQAQYAVGLGGIFGTGPGRGSTIPPLGAASNVYISNIHSDYVFIQIVEEYGVFGGTLVLAIFFALCLYSLSLSQHLDSQLWRVVAAACGLWWGTQLLTIIGGTLRLLPLIGIPVPFISYGRTAAITNGIVLGCLLAASLGAHVGYVDLRSQRRQTSFAALRTAITAGFLLIMLWFTCGMYLVDRYIFTDLQAVAAAVPDTPEYLKVSHPRQLGPRAQCLIRGYPQHRILTTDELLLMEPTRVFEGCDRYAAPNYSNAQQVGLSRALQDIQSGNTQFAHRLREDDVALTIDWVVQEQAAERLRLGLSSSEAAPWGQALVIDVRPEREGQILALVDFTESQPSRPPFQLGRYIPGSVFKVVTALSALRAGMTPTDEIDCNAGANIPGRNQPVSNSLGGVNCAMAGFQTNLAYALAYSVNTFFAGLTDAASPTNWPAESQLPLDRNQLLHDAQRVGMVEPDPNVPLALYANFSLPMIGSSVTGLTITDTNEFMHSPQKWADTVYGQGNAEVTIVQQAVLMQLIANDGVAATPRLIEDAISPNWHGQKLTPAEAAQLRSLLHEAVSIPHVSPATIGDRTFSLAGASHLFDSTGQQLVAGKTGTAEYGDAPPVSWFAGFAPFDRPEYVVVVMVSQQHNEPANACSAAAIAGTIFEFLLDAPEKRTCHERGI